MDGGIICRIDFDNLRFLPLIPYKSNTICAAWEGAFGIDHADRGDSYGTYVNRHIRRYSAHRGVSSIVVPVMALGYIALALGIVLFNITRLPAVIETILSNAFWLGTGDRRQCRSGVDARD